MPSFFASAYSSSGFADRGPIESHAARIDAPIAPVAANKKRRRSMPKRSAAWPGRKTASGTRRCIAFREQVDEWSRVARFRREIVAIFARDHRRDRIRIDRENHEDVTHRQRDEQQHRQKMPVARPNESAEQMR